MDYTYSVSVIKKQTHEVVKNIDAIGLNKANKVKDGLEINLNHSVYFVIIRKQD